MADYGVTDKGFVRPRLPEIRLEIIEAIKSNLRGAGLPDDIETRPDSIMGLMIDTFADREAALWETSEAVYYSMYPSSATGSALDRAVSFAGVTRIQAEPSQAFVAVYGDASTLIPAGSQIRSRRTNNIWETVEDVTIGAGAAIDVEYSIEVQTSTLYRVNIDGTDYDYTSGSTDSRQIILNGITNALSGIPGITATNNGVILRILSNIDSFSITVSNNFTRERLASRVLAQTVDPIPEVAEPGDLNNIVTLITGWTAVNNLQGGVAGRNTETDAELRSRYGLSVFRLGSSTVPAIEANIRERVLGVDNVRVFENRSDTTQDGLAPHSIQVVVDGGLNEPIAQEIYNNKAGGIDTNGAIEVTLQTDQGEQKIKFDRPERVFIWFKIVIQTLGPEEGETLPSDWAQQIRDNIGNVKLPIGFDVLPQRFIKEVFKVPGIESVDLQVFGSTNSSDDPTGQYSPNPIVIDRDQMADLSNARVDVT